ncbi:hypothetical protein WR25_23152 isoform A [Diploscapter pachys]|uniref:Uncharacterized protein n=1 Tax=Diploscapter pachys TaxID=2018661 RepID=A0A2A2LZR0_9BILA|nr:hypothetical protein WR25_23152 isoform A [Diploscapter pachys]
MGVLSKAGVSGWFPPISSRTLLNHYLPASGAVSHSLYAVHIFSPSIISNLFPVGDLAVSNTILCNSMIGAGAFVYSRRHLQRSDPWDRVEFSVLASSLFNFGSLLAAVLIKALLPPRVSTYLKSAVAVTLSIYLLSRGRKYMTYLDNRSARGSPSPTRFNNRSPSGNPDEDGLTRLNGSLNSN